MEGVTQNDLARAFDITPASMSTMTVRLVTAGLVLRKSRLKETRSNRLQLSTKGQALMAEIHQIWSEVDHYIEELIGKEEACQLRDMTHTLREKLGGVVPHQSDTK
jgi:DNA-binding MarR family transcriptional regulator